MWHRSVEIGPMRVSKGIASVAAQSLVGVLVQGLARLLCTILIGRFFEPEVLGELSYALSIMVLLALTWPTPTGNTFAHYANFLATDREARLAVLALLNRTIVIASAVLAITTIALAAPVMKNPTVLIFSAALTVAYGVYTYARAAQISLGRARHTVLWDGVASVLSLAFVVGVIIGHLDALILMPLTLGYALFAVFCWPRARTPYRPAPRVRRDVVSYASWTALTGFASNASLQVPMLTAPLFSSQYDTGLFAAAFSIATPVSMIGQAVALATLPAFTHSLSSGKSIRRSAKPFIVRFTVVIILLLGVVAFLTPTALTALYGVEYASAADSMRVMLMGLAPFTVTIVMTTTLLAMGRSRIAAVISFSTLVITVTVAAALGFAGLGILAGAWGFTSGALVGALVTIGVLYSLRASSARGHQPR